MIEHRENLEAVEKLLQPLKKMLGQAADTVMEQDVSSYPIFVLAQESISMGLSLLKAGQLPDGWMVHLSTLEEFAAKKLVDIEKVNDFKSIYKKPTDYLCLFVIEDIGATFVFLPRS